MQFSSTSNALAVSVTVLLMRAVEVGAHVSIVSLGQLSGGGGVLTLSFFVLAEANAAKLTNWGFDALVLQEITHGSLASNHTLVVLLSSKHSARMLSLLLASFITLDNCGQPKNEAT
ncbi:MAG: hypothetical protein AAI978_00940 [Candidatus Hodgkinia cicadicola]